MGLVQIFATADVMEGRLLAGRLGSEDIPVLLKGGEPPYNLGPVYLFVPEEDEIRARLFVDAVRAGTLETGPQDLEAARASARAMLELLDDDLAAGRISERAWFESVADVITSLYLSSDDPRAGSGYHGDETRWEHARSLLLDAIDRDGSFLDVGCANGYLMESVVRWGGARGRRIEPHGLEISPALAALARHRLPEWSQRIHEGNVLDWAPSSRFDFVRTELDYVPVTRGRDLVSRLIDDVVAPGGRLIVGVVNEDRATAGDGSVENTIAGWGFVVSGRTERPHFVDERRSYRAVWIDAPA